ncbi:MAG: peptidylprolyl isomerase [Sporichthyaceae bacterium]
MAGQGKQTSAERRKQKAAEARAKAQAEARKRRLQVVGGTLAVALVAGGVFAGVAALTGGDDTDSATQEPSPTPTAAAAIDQTGVAEGKRRCSYPKGTESAAKDVGLPDEIADAKGVVYATFVTNKGTIQVEMDRAAAPCTVNSFVHLAENKYYDNTPCHRLLDETNGQFTNAVLQCGDPTGKGTGGPGYSFPDENLTGATYGKGVMAMANSGPNTNGSQFFWMFKDSDFSPDYVPFGKILSGVDVIAKIAEGGRSTNPQSGADDVPKTKTTIEQVTVSTTKPGGKADGTPKPESTNTAKPESTEKPKS